MEKNAEFTIAMPAGTIEEVFKSFFDAANITYDSGQVGDSTIFRLTTNHEDALKIERFSDALGAIFEENKMVTHGS